MKTPDQFCAVQVFPLSKRAFVVAVRSGAAHNLFEPPIAHGRHGSACSVYNADCTISVMVFLSDL
jgi:hypothetical protein